MNEILERRLGNYQAALLNWNESIKRKEKSVAGEIFVTRRRETSIKYKAMREAKNLLDDTILALANESRWIRRVTDEKIPVEIEL